MKQPGRIRGNQRLQLGMLILLCLMGGYGCGGSGSSASSVDLLTHQENNVLAEAGNENQNVIVLQQKSARLRKGVCWNERSELKEVNRQRLRNSANKSCGAVDHQRQLQLLLASN